MERQFDLEHKNGARPGAPAPSDRAQRFTLHGGGRDDAGGASPDDGLAATGLRALLSTLEARDRLTGAHCATVAQLVWQTAHRMGLDEAEATQAAQVALVHDIGKVAIPDTILLKPGPLTDGEWRVMHRHPEIGESIVASISALAHLAPAVRAEHERWDGQGYPDGLSGEAIPLASRLVFACDAYQAMISDRPYRAAMARDDALVELQAKAGSQFDPAVIAALIGSLASIRDHGEAAVGNEPPRSVPDPGTEADSAASTLLSAPQPVTAGTARGSAFDYNALADDERLATSGAGALDVLYGRHQQMVYRYCLRVLRKPEAAADAAQATWMQAMVALSAPDTVVRNVRAWLRAIARNECLDVLRGNTATQTQDIDTLELSSGPTPESAYETREQLQSLLVDLKTLSERQRSAIVLRELCGLSSGELADEFQTTPQRASGLVADARRTLAQRRSGRQLECIDVCDELRQGPRRSIAVRAHLEICASCTLENASRTPRTVASTGPDPTP